jgi:hypothetical protein
MLQSPHVDCARSDVEAGWMVDCKGNKASTSARQRWPVKGICCSQDT